MSTKLYFSHSRVKRCKHKLIVAFFFAWRKSKMPRDSPFVQLPALLHNYKRQKVKFVTEQLFIKYQRLQKEKVGLNLFIKYLCICMCKIMKKGIKYTSDDQKFNMREKKNELKTNNIIIF